MPSSCRILPMLLGDVGILAARAAAGFDIVTLLPKRR